jgi:hypothetical protein
MAREEGNRPSCPLESLKPPVLFEFADIGLTNIDGNRMPLVHYIDQFKAAKVMLFHHDIVPFCANTRENNPRNGVVGRQEFSVCATERNTVRVVHCNSSLHRETFVASFAPSRLRHPLLQ